MGSERLVDVPSLETFKVMNEALSNLTYPAHGRGPGLDVL